jgi:hypothetical protein
MMTSSPQYGLRLNLGSRIGGLFGQSKCPEPRGVFENSARRGFVLRHGLTTLSSPLLLLREGCLGSITGFL